MTCFNPRRPHQQASVGNLLTAVSGTQQGKHNINVSSSVLTSWLGGSVVKNPPTSAEMQARSLGSEVPLEKEMATHPSIRVWKISDGGAWWAAGHGIAKKSDTTERLN